MESGIYQIENVVNGKLYIGSAANLEGRKNCHFRELRTGKHGNTYLQNAFKKHGEASFVFSVIEECSRKNLISREQHYLDRIGIQNLYNICGTAGSQLGTKRSDETRTRISKAKTGRKHSAETRATMRIAKMGNKSHLGRNHSKATRDRLREASTGRQFSAVRKERISTAKKKPVQQIDKTSGKVLATFDSQESAGVKTGVNLAGISQCCCGKQKSAGGFHWRFL